MSLTSANSSVVVALQRAGCQGVTATSWRWSPPCPTLLHGTGHRARPLSFIGRMKRSLGFSSQTFLEEQSSHSNLLLQQFKAFLESFEVYLVFLNVWPKLAKNDISENGLMPTTLLFLLRHPVRCKSMTWLLLPAVQQRGAGGGLATGGGRACDCLQNGNSFPAIATSSSSSPSPLRLRRAARAPAPPRCDTTAGLVSCRDTSN